MSRGAARLSSTTDTIFLGVAWSPDGHLLACGSFLPSVQVWDMTTRSRRWVRRTEPTLIRRVAWSPDGTRVVGGGGDGSVYMWDIRDDTELRLEGHKGAVLSVTWSPNGMLLASGGGSIENRGAFRVGSTQREVHPNPGGAFWSCLCLSLESRRREY